MRLHEVYNNIRKPIMEGGKAIPDSTPFDHKVIPAIMSQVNKIMPIDVQPIGSGATPTPGKVSGDLDVIVDQEAVAKAAKVDDPKLIRKWVRSLFDQAGLQTAQSGSSVHVGIPVDGETHQVDVMIYPQADKIAKFHTHDIPADSNYKGKHKHIAMSKLAKSKGMMWSGFQGLFTRDPETNKKVDFISNDLDEIAKHLLGDNASAKDLGSVETILAALPAEQAASLKAEIDADPQS